MEIRFNIYLITAILLTPNLLTICESGSDASYNDGINHAPLLYSAGPLSDDHLDHLDLSDYLGGEGPANHESITRFQTNSVQSNNFGNNDDNNDKVTRSVEITHHDGNTITKYETTTHTDQDTNAGSFDDRLMSSGKPSNMMPGTFTKVIKKTVINCTKNGGNNNNDSKESRQTMRKMYSENKSKETDIGYPSYGTQTISEIDRLATNNGMLAPMVPPNRISGTPGNSQNVMKTIVTKTTTSGLRPTDDFDGPIGKMVRLDGLKSIPSNMAAFTKMGPSDANRNGVISSVSPDEGGRFRTVSMATGLNHGHGYDGVVDEQRVLLRKPEGSSFKRTQTTMVKRQGQNDGNDLDGLDEHGFDNANARSSNDNVVMQSAIPSEYDQFITTSATSNPARPLQSSSGQPRFGRTQTTTVERHDDGDSNDGNRRLGNPNDHVVVAPYNNNDGNVYPSNGNTNYGNSKVSSDRYVNNNGYGTMGHDSGNVIPMGEPMTEGPKGNSFGGSQHGLHHRRKSHNHRCKCADRVNAVKRIGSAVAVSDRNSQSYETEYGNRKTIDGTGNRNSQTYTSRAYGVRSPAESSDSYSRDSVVQQGIAVLPRRRIRIRKLNRMYAGGSGSNEIGRSQKLGQSHRSLPPSPFRGLPPHGPPPFGPPPHGPPPFGPPPFGPPPFGPPPFGPPPTGSLQHEQSISNDRGETVYNRQRVTDSQYPDLTTFNTTDVVSQYSPYDKQEHYFGSLGPLVGDSFDSFKMFNKPPPMPDRYQRLFGQQPSYSSFQDRGKSFSTSGPVEMYPTPLASPGNNMFSQYGQQNQIISKTESSRTDGSLQQGGNGSDSDLNVTDALKSESMTTADTQSRMVSTDGQPFTGYMKTIKTTKTVNGNDPPEIHVVKTESVIPAIDGSNN